MPRTATVRKTTKPAATPVPSRFERMSATHVLDRTSGLMWTHTLGEATFKNAQKLIDEANAEKLGGYSDWRLPTVEELFCLADRTKSSPAIDTEAFPDTKSDWYWSGTPYAPGSDYAWIVGFYSGNSSYDGVGLRSTVRAVRASQ